MNYRDVYKNMLKKRGGSVIGNEILNSKRDVNLTFEEDAGYRLANITYTNLLSEDIDVRLVNIDRTTKEKYIMFRPDTKLNTGEIVCVDGERWLINEIEDNLISPKCHAWLCFQEFNLPDCPKQYVFLDDSSYGQKGVNSSPLMDFVDGQLKCYIQDNIYTRAIPDGYRIMFDGLRGEVYEVTQNTIVTTRYVRRISFKKTDDDDRDDFKNNIAYNYKKLIFNEDYENHRHSEINYTIKDTNGYYHSKYCPDGYDLELCKRDCTKIYICDELGNDLSDIVFDITSNIDIVNKYDSSVEIVSKGNNYIEVKNLYGYNGSDFIITFEKDDIKIPIKIKLSR